MKFLGLLAVCVAALLAMASSAMARDLRCNGVVEGKTYEDVVVPSGAACTLVGTTVKGNVRVLRNAYLQTVGAVVHGDVEGSSSQTVFIDSGSRIRGSVESVGARQFFVYNSSVGEDIEPERTREAVQICGNTVRRGNIEVRGSGPAGSPAQQPGTDILIGDPLAVGCKGNTVKRGDVIVTKNFANIEFVIRGNTIKRGDLKVTGNTGPVPKIVDANVGGIRLVCIKNSSVSATSNSRWDHKRGQCS
jgi:hypothetical protein